MYFVFKHEGELEIKTMRSDGEQCSAEALAELVTWCRDLARDVKIAEGGELEFCHVDKLSTDPAPLELRFRLKLSGVDLKFNFRLTFIATGPPFRPNLDDLKIKMRVVRGDSVRLETYHAAAVYMSKVIPWMLEKQMIEVETFYGAAVI